jgi:hypothetical protein
MNYDIKIIGEDEDNGSIEFDRLNSLTKSTKDIASKALMLRLGGYSGISPDKPLKKALQMFLQDVKGDSKAGTALTIDCLNFSETIKGLQLDLFRPNEKVLELTPMALVISAFHTALDPETEEADLDKPLLNSLLNFKRNFISDNEIIYLANRGSIAEVKLTKESFQKIEVVQDSIPEPKNIIVNGKLDEIKMSKSRLGLATESGIVNLIATDTALLKNLVGFMGNEITIKGMAHYKPNGHISFIEISEYYTPEAGDKYFSKVPAALVSNQQVLFKLKNSKVSNSLQALKNISGLLKDEISDADFEEMMKDIHR